MSSGAGARRKRETSEEQFRLLLKRLDAVEERAWEIHDNLRRKLIWFFESDFPVQAEDLSEEALDRIARKLETEEIKNIAEFAFGVARNLRREALRRNVIATRLIASGALGTPAHSGENPEQVVMHRLDLDRKLACYRECLQRLSPEDRNLLSRYYPEDGAGLEQRREELARELQISMGALRTKMARLREQLEKYFETCYASRSKSRGRYSKDE